MPTKIFLLCAIGCYLLTTASTCDVDSPSSDPRCNNGLNFMSCTINGEYWETGGGGGINWKVDVYYDNWNHNLTVSGQSSMTDQLISIYISDDLDTIGLNSNLSHSTLYLHTDGHIYDLDTSGTYPNQVEITYWQHETIPYCIEGTFQFRAIESRDRLDTVVIENGYFRDRLSTN